MNKQMPNGCNHSAFIAVYKPYLQISPCNSVSILIIAQFRCVVNGYRAILTYTTIFLYQIWHGYRRTGCGLLSVLFRINQRKGSAEIEQKQATCNRGTEPKAGRTHAGRAESNSCISGRNRAAVVGEAVTGGAARAAEEIRPQQSAKAHETT